MNNRRGIQRWPWFVTWLALAPVQAAWQTITADPPVQSAAADTAVAVGVRYATADPCTMALTGLGLRVHWDSTRLQFEGLSDVLPDAMVAVAEPELDNADEDGNPATDRAMLVAWADIDGAWPGGACRSVDLLHLGFRTSPDFAGEAAVGFSASSTAAGFSLDATPGLIRSGAADEDGDGVPDRRDAHPQDPDLPVDELRIALQPGLNLIGYGVGVAPVHADCRELLADRSDAAVQTLARIDPASGRLEYCDPAAPFRIDTATGYALFASAAAELLLYDDIPCAARAYTAGTHWIAHPAPAPGLTCRGWLAELGKDRVSAIRHLDRVSNRFLSCAYRGGEGTGEPVGADFGIERGAAYLLSLVRDQSLELGTCP